MFCGCEKFDSELFRFERLFLKLLPLILAADFNHLAFVDFLTDLDLKIN